MLKNNWVATVSYQQLDINANLPSDYEPGGKRFGSGRKTWFTTEAGISVISGDEFSFTKQPVEIHDSYTTSNYGAKSEANIKLIVGWLNTKKKKVQ